MKQTLIHDRNSIPLAHKPQLRTSIQSQKDKQQISVRRKGYKLALGSSKHKSIYSLALESNILINDIDLNPPKAYESLDQRDDPIHKQNARRSRENSSICISKDIKLQRYSRNEQCLAKREGEDEGEKQQQNRQKITLLKRIIEHYNIKSFECNYYSNLMNNLGIKVSAGSELKTRLASTKISTAKFQREDTRPIKHDRSTKAKYYINANTSNCDDFFANNLMKVEAQSIHHLIKNESEVPGGRKEGRAGEGKEGSKNVRKTNHSLGSKKEMFRQATCLKFYEWGENSVSTKVNKYKEFVYMINLAHGVYRELDIDKYEAPFKFYVGLGNNGNLVRAILKKRFWFEPTKNREEAHLVWTQLKDENIFKLQLLRDQHASLFARQKPNKVQLQELTNSTTALSSLEEGCQTSETKPINNSYKQESTLKGSSTEALTPYFRILTSEQGSSYFQMMSELSYGKRKGKGKFRERMRHTRGLRVLEGWESVHNHLPLNGLLGNKKAMYYMMREYCLRTQKSLGEIVPLTFHIKRGLGDEQFKEFMGRFNQNRASKRPNFWIMKPGEFSNRGQGISCTSRAQEVRARINSLRREGKSLILQEYITSPLLYHGRKFDIRTYMLVSTNGGSLRAYWYQDGYVRTSSYPWGLDDLQDSLVHLTNDAIQKHSPHYGRYEPANKLTYSELQRYLDTLPKTPKTKYSFQGEVYPRLKEIAGDAVRASFQFLQGEGRGSNFEVYGLDFMIDSSFKPWLIEINTNPCLEVNCPVLERVIPSMLENAFRIALDPLFPPPLNYSSTHKYTIPENALHYNRFELIFDQHRDAPALLALYRGSRVLEAIEDYEEEKEVYESEGEEVDLQDN